MIVAAASLGLLVGWARGGRLGGVARRRLYAFPLLGIAGVLVLLARTSWLPVGAGRLLVDGGYLVALLMLWYNRRRPWIPLVLTGTALNGLVILVNGGRMPIAPAALFGAGQPPILGEHLAAGVVDQRHLLAGPGTPLALLGDSLPLHLGGFGTVASPGDLLMALGVAGYLGTAMSLGGLPDAPP